MGVRVFSRAVDAEQNRVVLWATKLFWERFSAGTFSAKIGSGFFKKSWGIPLIFWRWLGKNVGPSWQKAKLASQSQKNVVPKGCVRPFRQKGRTQPFGTRFFGVWDALKSFCPPSHLSHSPLRRMLAQNWPKNRAVTWGLEFFREQLMLSKIASFYGPPSFFGSDFPRKLFQHKLDPDFSKNPGASPWFFGGYPLDFLEMAWEECWSKIDQKIAP